MVFQQPDFLVPVLEYLSDVLPPPLYSILVKVLSHSLAALTAISQLCASLLSDHPSNWHAQALLPPIITIIVAYLALMSLYRTTSWLIRLMFWCIKWGSLFGIFMAGVGYFMGNAGGNAVGLQGALPVLGNLISTLLDDKEHSSRHRQKKSRKSKPKSRRPKAWDSFDAHQQWQYQENQGRDENPQMQQVMDMVTSAAGKIFTGNWWNTAENIVKNTPKPDQSKKSAKSKGQHPGSSRSR
ncbi:hypothetical protein CVT25_012162 [Psilocybe cyanescens]|uniref:Uncharacterized protein n=1 Tax=Psilocybe cyanescens TaxID=93625 RepID=A0A409XFG8_PSICY|nr:hypothetical protein CVT25_012162 [Psilocybe cyanescens]